MALTSVSDIIRVDLDRAVGGGGDGEVTVQALSDGGFAVAWREIESEDGVAGSYRIYTRKFDSALAPVSGPVKIDGVDGDPQTGDGFTSPSIVALADGGFAVEYTDTGGATDFSNGQPYSGSWGWLADFGADGSLTGQGTPFGRPDASNPDQSRPILGAAVTEDGAGGYHYVVAQESGFGGARLYIDGRLVASSGVYGEIGMEKLGTGVLLTWQSGTGDGANVMGMFVNGNSSSEGVIFNSQRVGEQVFGDRNDRAALLSNGSFVLVWTDKSSADDAIDPGTGVRARIFDPSGNPLTDEIVVPADPASNEGHPAVAALSGNRFVVCYVDERGAVAQIFSATGERLGGEMVITPEASATPTMTVLEDDRIVFTWNGDGRTYVQAWRFPDIFGTEAGETVLGTGQFDVLHGLGGNDRLNGLAGADEMIGGEGDDVYVADNAGDSAIESANGGNDRVYASVDHSLAAGSEIEILSTTSNAGLAAIDLAGNELANWLIGNAGSNHLDGKGGSDRLSGLGGNDGYAVDSAADLVFETAGGGTDRIYARASYILRSGVEVELLSTASNAGTAAINLTGNEIANTLYGNEGANTLRGGAGGDLLSALGGSDRLYGGDGNDRLNGGAGTDNFYFDAALHGTLNVDQLLSFSAADDRIWLSRSVFGGIAAGVLAGDAFVVGAVAADSSDRIVYDQASGRIFYDSDGAGGAAAILFATVAPGTILSHADFAAYG